MIDYLTDLEPQFKLARKRNRWFAALIDYFIYSLIVVLFIFAFGEPVPNDEGGTTYTLNGGWPMLILLLLWFALLPVFEYFNKGQTLGKLLLRVRAAKMDGTQASFGQVLGRHLLDFVDYMPGFGIVGIIVSSNTPNKQRVGDLVAKTIVIEAN